MLVGGTDSFLNPIKVYIQGQGWDSVVEHLPSICKALGSLPRTEKKKKKKKKNLHLKVPELHLFFLFCKCYNFEREINFLKL
jgi:hypothetical protein